MKSRPKVFLADDHALLLDAFAKLLERDYDVVGRATDGRELLEKAPAARPDVVILDIGMPRMNGIDAARRLREKHPDVKIIFLTMDDDVDLAAQALESGASGFLLKNGAGSELSRALESVLRGRTYITPLIAGEVLQRVRAGTAAEPRLTPRQREVLQLIGEGRSMKEIAAQLGITARTVAHHKYTMMESLGIETTAELVRLALRKKLIS